MRAEIWDCAPHELTVQDLAGEAQFIKQMWAAVWRQRYGHPHALADHPQLAAFEARPWLLVARRDFLWMELRARGVGVELDLTTALPGGEGVMRQDAIRMVVVEEHRDWYEFCIMHDWPVTATEHGSPWEQEGIPYQEYRRREDAAQAVDT